MNHDNLLIQKLEQASGQPYDQLRPEIARIAHHIWTQNQQNQLDNWLEAEYILLHHLYQTHGKAPSSPVEPRDDIYTSTGAQTT
jgi:hypothetical protein